MEMKFRKVKRRCDVRKCRNTDCYSISYAGEAGNSVIICKDCIDTAYGLIIGVTKQTIANAKEKNIGNTKKKAGTKSESGTE